MPTVRDRQPQILIVVTSHDTLGQTGVPTGLWLEEVAAPYLLFSDAGIEVTIASPEGGRAPIDPASLAEPATTPAVVRFRSDPAAAHRLAATMPLSTIDPPAVFDAIYLVGGHGSMWDFPANQELGGLLKDAVTRNAIIASICHGTAGLLSATTTPGTPGLIRGRQLTGFTNEEEAALGLTEAVPFLLQTRLEAHGATVHAGPAFVPNVVVDQSVVTGQNPASSLAVAQAVLTQLSHLRGAPAN